MAQCAQCETQETNLYENGVPICLACATDKAAGIRREHRSNGNGTTDRKGDNLPEGTKRSV
jgi:hypothetical protein